MIARSERSVVLIAISGLVLAGFAMQPVALAKLYRQPVLPYLNYGLGIPLGLAAAWFSIRFCRGNGFLTGKALWWSALAAAGVSLMMLWALSPQFGMRAATLAILPVVCSGASLAGGGMRDDEGPERAWMVGWVWPCWAGVFCSMSGGATLPIALIGMFAVCLGAWRHPRLRPVCDSIGVGVGLLIGWYASVLLVSAYRRQKLATLLLIDHHPLDRFGILFQHFQVQRMLTGEGALVRVPGANDQFLLATLIGHSGYLGGAAVAVAAVGVILWVVKRLLRKPDSVECAFGLSLALLLLLHAFTNVLANTGVIAYPALALPFFTPSIPLFIVAGCFGGVVWSAVPMHVSSAAPKA